MNDFRTTALQQSFCQFELSIERCEIIQRLETLAVIEPATLNHESKLSTNRRGGGLAVHETHYSRNLEFVGSIPALTIAVETFNHCPCLLIILELVGR